MSTKIYNAYRYKGNNVNRLIEMLRKIKQDYIIEKAREIGERRDCPEDWKALVERIRLDSSKDTYEPFGISASAAIYFVKDEIYVQFFEVPNEIIKKHKRYLKDWHYQNSTDCPSHIDEKEWTERERFWDKVLKKYLRPSDIALSFDFADVYAVANYVEQANS